MKRKFIVAAAVIFSVSVHAQNKPVATQDSSKMLGEVIITANKVLQKQDQTGKVVSVISREELEKKQGRTLPQILNEQAGITVNGALNAMGNNQAMYVRGSGAGRTLVLLDGIPVYDPSLINNEFDLNLLLVNDIERIEICRGAQSTLYGSDAVSGVVNIISIKKNPGKKITGKGNISAGSFGTARGSAQVSGQIKKLSFTARYAGIRTDGFSSSYDSTGKENYDKDGYKGSNVNASIQYQFLPQLIVKTFMQHSQYKSGIDASVFADEKDNTIKNKSLVTGSGFIFNNNGVSVKGNYQYSETSRLYLNDSIHVPGFTLFARDKYFSKAQFAELYAAIPLHSTVTLLQGADYRWNSMNNQYFALSGFGPFESAISDTNLSQASLYASLLYKSENENFTFDLGGRLNVDSRYGSNYTYTFNPSYKLNNQYRIFGSIATGFKAPTLYQAHVSPGTLNAEKSITYEAGLSARHKYSNNRLVLFYRDIKDGLDYDYNNWQYFNFVKQVVRGVEFESEIKPSEKFTVTFNYTYLSAREKTQSRINFKDTSYHHLLRRPAHHANITAGVQIIDKWYASVNGKYVGSRYDVGGWQTADIKLDDYFIWGAYSSYNFNKHLKLFADAQNISNKKFFDVRGYNSIPLTVNAGLSLQW